MQQQRCDTGVKQICVGLQLEDGQQMFQVEHLGLHRKTLLVVAKNKVKHRERGCSQSSDAKGGAQFNPKSESLDGARGDDEGAAPGRQFGGWRKEKHENAHANLHRKDLPLCDHLDEHELQQSEGHVVVDRGGIMAWPHRRLAGRLRCSV